MKRFYNIDMDESDWCTNQTSDNVASNLKLTRLLGIDHICCNNHLLSNEVKLWLKNTADESNGPGYVCGHVHETMVSIKNSNKS